MMANSLKIKCLLFRIVGRIRIDGNDMKLYGFVNFERKVDEKLIVK
jgi:hypothetical protein